MTSEHANALFRQSIADYHRADQVDAPMPSVHVSDTMDSLLYRKNWIDTVQWHLEDLIRSPEVQPSELVALKRRIDHSNQDRTDTVEQMDDWFMAYLRQTPGPEARLNSETPAWLLDRMSILQLKIYHMHEQTVRTDVSEEHRSRCSHKLTVLREQETDLARCFDELLEDIRAGRRYMKLYRQMKMYNDATLNPVLYGKSS